MKNEEELKLELKSFENLWYGGFYNNIKSRGLYNIIEYIIPFIKNKKLLEIGCGGGDWTQHFEKYTSEIYCFDALSKQHNSRFEENVKYICPIHYIKVEDFSCKDIPDNTIDVIFSFDVFCHISYSGTEEYFRNLHSKLKEGGNCFIMIADKNKYEKVHQLPNGYFSDKNYDEDGVPEPPGRWYWYGIDKFCSMLEKLNYTIKNRDLNLSPRDPIIHFIK